MASETGPVHGYWTIGGDFIVAHADPQEDDAPLVKVSFYNEAAASDNKLGWVIEVLAAMRAAREAEGRGDG